MNWLHRILSTYFVLHLRQVIVSSKSFILKPQNTVVGIHGGPITFQWKVNGAIIYRNWKYRGVNNKLKSHIIAQVNHVNSTYEQVNIYEAYKGRISFTFGSPQLTLANLTFTDIGEYSCEVVLRNGNTQESSTHLIIYVIPKFGTSLPATVKAVEYNDVKFTCNISSRPVIDNITWSHSGQHISSNDNRRLTTVVKDENGMLTHATSTLMLRNITRYDRGEYECNARHYFGDFNKSTILTVHTLPIISYFPKQDLHVIEYTTNVTINCEAHGNPLPTITWYKDYKLINHSDVRYDLHSIKGTYSSSKDEFINSTLTIKNVTTVDFGYYTCEASNVLFQLGEQRINDSIYVLVKYESRFLNPSLPSVYKVVNGSQLVLNCTVDAYPPPQVSWAVTVPTNNRFSFKTTILFSNERKTILQSLLIIDYVLIQDTGSYTCLSNNIAITKSWKTEILVQYPPKFNTRPPVIQVVPEFSLSYLECSVHSYPVSKIEWFYISDNITRMNVTDRSTVDVLKPLYRYESRLKSRLSFNKSISRKNTGRYVCSVSNFLSTEEAYTDIYVQWPPEFHSSSISGNMHIKQGLNTTLKCLVQSNPSAHISWKHNQLVLNTTITSIVSSNRTMTVKSSLLTLNNVSVEDSGVYTCMANNSVGGVFKERKRSIVLNVLYSPILLVNSTTQNISSQSSGFEISCESKAYPPVTKYKWSKDGINMFHNKSVFRVREVNITNQGTYKCTPENTEGIGETVTHVITVLVSPGVTLPAQCYPDLGILYCSCAGFGNPPIEIYWTKSPSDVILSNKHTLNISINLNVSGIYICHLKNVHGKTETARQITALVVGMSAQMYWHKDWYIVFWVLIPIIIILILICILWLARRHRNSNKAVFVTSNRNTSDVPPTIRNIQTRPDIYLPNTPNSFSAINNGYVAEDREKQDKESMEVVMYLAEDCTNSSIWFSPPHNSPISKCDSEEHTKAPEKDAPRYKQDGTDEVYEYMGVTRENSNQSGSLVRPVRERPQDDDHMSNLTDDIDGSVYL